MMPPKEAHRIPARPRKADEQPTNGEEGEDGPDEEKRGEFEDLDWKGGPGEQKGFTRKGVYRVTDQFPRYPLTLPAVAGGDLVYKFGHQGKGKIYDILIRTSGDNGRFVGARVELDNENYDFLTMDQLNTRGVFQANNGVYPWLAKFDDVANEFTMLWTPSIPRTYYGTYRFYLRNAGPGDAVIEELFVHRLVLWEPHTTKGPQSV